MVLRNSAIHIAVAGFIACSMDFLLSRKAKRLLWEESTATIRICMFKRSNELLRMNNGEVLISSFSLFNTSAETSVYPPEIIGTGKTATHAELLALAYKGGKWAVALIAPPKETWSWRKSAGAWV
jgi:hypothetical protein